MNIRVKNSSSVKSKTHEMFGRNKARAQVREILLLKAFYIFIDTSDICKCTETVFTWMAIQFQRKDQSQF